MCSRPRSTSAPHWMSSLSRRVSKSTIIFAASGGSTSVSGTGTRPSPGIDTRARSQGTTAKSSSPA
eukprot:3346244-Pyramimonas_sp.AAC.1